MPNPTGFGGNNGSATETEPLPKGWDVGQDYDGKIYYIDHNSKKTTWTHPRATAKQQPPSLPPPLQQHFGSNASFSSDSLADDDLHHHHVPVSTEVKTSPTGLDQEVWRIQQQDMLKKYLMVAESDLKTKLERVDIKQQRLHLAQDEYNHLNHDLATLSASTTSLNSTGSTASTTKYDPDLLRSDVQLARERVHRLKRELVNIDTEMSYKQKGVETLAQVSAKFSTEDRPATSLEEAYAIRNELSNIQRSLSNGEQEKVELMKSLACLKDDLTRLQHSETALDDSSLNNPMEKFSIASQTDLSGDLIPIGARLNEMTQLRLQYDEARRNVQDIQQALAGMEERLSPGQLESDKDRLLLIQDKEQLLRELRSINPRSRSKAEMKEIKGKIQRLEQDLNNAMEVSNRCIADRLRLHEEKQYLLQQLRDGMRNVSKLESQLKVLSAATSSMSISSSSSLGSLSSSHASSKGSLSSLSFTDIYGLSTTQNPDPSMLDLHRRVEKILGRGHQNPSANHESVTDDSSVNTSGSEHNQNFATPSPRSSLSSSTSSPPISPHVQNLPFHHPESCTGSNALDHLPLMEKHRRIQQQLAEVRTLSDQIAELNGAKVRSPAPKLSTIAESCNKAKSSLTGYDYLSPPDLEMNQPPLSPISETAGGLISKGSSSAAISDESVAGDSGVYEAVSRTQLGAMNNLETAQVQIKLRYSVQDSLLHVGIERARNLSTLSVPEDRKIVIKASLLPLPSGSAAGAACSLCTRAISPTQKPNFGDNFPLLVPLEKLPSKTLQVTIWSTSTGETGSDDCLGSAQVSLADFDVETVSVRWYNILSFRFMQQPKVSKVRHKRPDSEANSAVSSKQGTLKEESSDESTIISSQTSTLTRSMGPEAMLVQAALNGVAANRAHGRLLESDDEDEDEDEEADDIVIPSVTEVLNSFSVISSINAAQTDKETNTECVFLQPSAAASWGRRVGPEPALVKRSQTFSPSAPISKNDYICRLNRSDSDSAMSLHKRLQFQRNLVERRSLRVVSSHLGLKSIDPVESIRKVKAKKIPSVQTSLDLELDLAAQQTKLQLLQDEIDRLKVMKKQLEEAKSKGVKELPGWLQENDTFQQMLSKHHQQESAKSATAQSKEDKKVEKLIRKTGKDIYKLRKTKSASKGQPDLVAFQEKMAFFTNIKNSVPAVSADEIEPSSSDLEGKGGDPAPGMLDPVASTVIAEAEADEDDESEETSRYSYDVDPDIGVIV